MKILKKEKFFYKIKYKIGGIKISFYKNVKLIINNIRNELKELTQHSKILVVVPSESILDYENAGYDWLERYYNPQKIFDKVFLLSPLEDGYYHKYGMTIIGVDGKLYKKLLSIINPNLVRAYGGYWPTRFVIKNKLDKIPVVCSIHDSREELLYNEIKYADYVFVTSEVVKQLAIKKGVSEKSIYILPNGVDTDIFKRVKNTIELEKKFGKGKYIITVGRRAYEKNIETVVKALAYLSEEYKLIQIGRGDPLPYKELAKEIQVENRCYFIDSVINSDLVYYYNLASCQCNPSHSEGFGIVFIEAGACECPIITSNLAPMNNMFTHKETAYLVNDYTNPEQMAKAITEVCENKSFAEKLGKNARELIINEFSKEKFEENHMKFYKQIIDR